MAANAAARSLQSDPAMMEWNGNDVKLLNRVLVLVLVLTIFVLVVRLANCCCDDEVSADVTYRDSAISSSMLWLVVYIASNDCGGRK